MTCPVGQVVGPIKNEASIRLRIRDMLEECLTAVQAMPEATGPNEE